MAEMPRYPDLNGKSTEQQIKVLNDHIVSLQRYMKWAFANIDGSNMTRSAKNQLDKITDIDGVNAAIDDFRVDLAAMDIEIKNIKGSINSLESRVNALEQTEVTP